MRKIFSHINVLLFLPVFILLNLYLLILGKIFLSNFFLFMLMASFFFYFLFFILFFTKTIKVKPLLTILASSFTFLFIVAIMVYKSKNEFSRLFSFLTSLRIEVFSYLFLFLSWILILRISYGPLLKFLIISVLILNTILIICLFKWVIFPYSTLHEALKTLSKKFDDIHLQTFKRKEIKKRGKSIKESLDWLTKLQDYNSQLFDYLDRIFEPRTTTYFFVLLFLLVIAVTILNFSFLYLSVEVIDENSFVGILAGESIWDYIYFSLVTITTTGFGDIIPQTKTAKIFVVLELLAGFSFLTIVILLFTTLRREITEDMATKFKSLYRELDEKILACKKDLSKDAEDVISVKANKTMD